MSRQEMLHSVLVDVPGDDCPLHMERIRCPNCGRGQDAEVLHTAPWPIYVHECANCGYTITESEWDVVLRCYVCHRPIDPNSDYEWHHDDDCPNATYYDNEDQPWYEGCTCDLNKCVTCAKAEEVSG